jgi:hypothetical protein
MPFVIPYHAAGTTDSIYVVKDDMYGSTVYKSAYDSNDPTNTSGTAWDTVLNFNVNLSSIHIKAYAVHNNKLYFGTSNSSALLYYSADGNHWTADSASTIPGVYSVSALASFGGYLYVAADTNGVPAIWRTNNDTSFTFVASFPNYSSITNFTVAAGQLWVALSGNVYSVHGAIMKSSDGLNFTASNANGFGKKKQFTSTK